MLGLISQALAALYVFSQSLPNRLWIPTTLMFIAGVIKYGERTRALFLASLDRFRDSLLSEPDPGPNYAKLMEEYASKREAKLPTQIIFTPEVKKETNNPDKTEDLVLNDVQVVKKAYKYFSTFKGLVVDLIFSLQERNESRDFFRRLTPEDALRVIEVELNFLYEVLYTKVQVVQSALGYVFRALALLATLSSLGVFYSVKKRGNYNNFDVRVTYTLLFGAIALDFIALVMLVFSDWTVATIEIPDDGGDKSRTIQKNDSLCMKLKLCWVSAIGIILKYKSPQWLCSRCMEKSPPQDSKVHYHHVMATPILFRRWSGLVSGHNLIRYCLKGSPKRVHESTGCTSVCIQKISKLPGIALLCFLAAIIYSIIIGGFLMLAAITRYFWKGLCTPIRIFVDWIGFLMSHRQWSSWLLEKISKSALYIWNLPDKLIGLLGLQDRMDSLRLVSMDPFTLELWRFIFTELKRKSDNADDPETAKRISASRGDWVLTDSDSNSTQRRQLMRFVTDVKYDESLLLWHIATELLYNDPEDQKRVYEEASTQTGHNSKCSKDCKEEDFRDYDYREFSKMLSDYMMYLLVMQPTMMSAVAGIGKIRFRDTCAEARRLFSRKNLKPRHQQEACKQILEVNTDVEPVYVKGDKSKSVLFGACILAKKRKELEKEKDKKGKENEEEEDKDKKKKESKWKLLSRMWVEILSYAAAQCRANTHAQQLSKGGELITFVWFLMAHFGLGEQFQINEGHASAKVVVSK